MSYYSFIFPCLLTLFCGWIFNNQWTFDLGFLVVDLELCSDFDKQCKNWIFTIVVYYRKSTFVFSSHSFPPISSLQFYNWNQLHQFIQPPFKRTGCWFWSDSLDPLLNRCFLYKYVRFLNILSYYFHLIEHLSSSISRTYGGNPRSIKIRIIDWITFSHLLSVFSCSNTLGLDFLKLNNWIFEIDFYFWTKFW